MVEFGVVEDGVAEHVVFDLTAGDGGVPLLDACDDVVNGLPLLDLSPGPLLDGRVRGELADGVGRLFIHEGVVRVFEAVEQVRLALAPMNAPIWVGVRRHGWGWMRTSPS